MRISLKIGMLATMAAAWSAASAWAYAPPPSFIVSQVAKKHADPKTLRIRSIVTTLGDEDRIRFKQTTVYDASTRTLRMRAYDAAGAELYATEKRLASSLISGALLDGNPSTLKNQLKSAGIPLKTEAELEAMPTEQARLDSQKTHLVRIDGAVAWVLAQDPKNPEQTQLWVEKDTFLPLKIVTQAQDKWWHAQFSQYRFFQEFPYPRSVVLNEPSGKPILKDELVELSVNPKLKDFPALSQSGFTEAGNSASSELRQLIQLYFRAVR